MTNEQESQLALALQAIRAEERFACWKIADEARKNDPRDKAGWLVAFDIANQIKMRDFASSVSRPHGESP